jgi:hypothetical protein
VKLSLIFGAAALALASAACGAAPNETPAPQPNPCAPAPDTGICERYVAACSGKYPTQVEIPSSCPEVEVERICGDTEAALPDPSASTENVCAEDYPNYSAPWAWCCRGLAVVNKGARGGYEAN